MSEVIEVFKLEDTNTTEGEKTAEEMEDDKESAVSKETTEEDNYMELYVEKELKDKFDPLSI